MSEILGNNPQVVDSKKDVVPVREETTQKLVVLKQDVGPVNPVVPEKTPESNESKPSFDRVFEGTESEAFTRENRQRIRVIVEANLGLDTYPWITPVHRENIAIANTDRLLQDPDFQSIFRTTVGFADIANNFMKGKVSGSGEAPQETVEKGTKSGLSDLERRIAQCIARVTEPLKGLLVKGQTPETLGLLSNPNELARYNGGEVRTDIGKMGNEELEGYIKGLNGKILEIDRRILPLEDLRERGMDFLAKGPDFLKDIFFWIFKNLPFIGNILAGFLGYKDSADVLNGASEEFRQRRSLGVLRGFGWVTDIEGKEKNGEYAGKIDILKGKDLSKINRKKLKDFFAFTQSEGINAETPDFWIGVFNDGKIVKKGSKGKNEAGEEVEVKDQEYAVDQIKGGDLDKDFEGLYEKLNKLYDKNENKKLSERQEVEKQTQAANEKAKQEAEFKQQSDLAAKKVEADKLNATLKPYRDLYEGRIINGKLVESLNGLVVSDFIDGKYRIKAEKVLSANPDKDKIIAVLSTYSGLLSANPKAMEHIKSCNVTDFRGISYQRQLMLVAAGYTSEQMKQTEIAIDVPGQAQQAPAQQPIPQQQSAETKKDEKVILTDSFLKAVEFPFVFGDKQVKFDNGVLCIGDQKFSLAGSNGLIPVDITNVSFSGDNLRLSHKLGTSLVARTEIAAGLPKMLEMKNSEKIEAEGKDGKIIITRVA